MIKAIITDVDGVLVGTKEGGHFPNPSPTIIEKLKAVGKQIPVVLCSGKPSFGLSGVIREMELDNWHIGTNGAVIFNPIQSKYQTNSIPTDIAASLIGDLTKADILHNIVGEETFFHPKDKRTPFTEKVAQARFIEPTFVEDLLPVVDDNVVVRVDAYIDEDQKDDVESVVSNYSSDLEVNFTSVQFDDKWIALITKKGSSKESSTKKIAEMLGISLEDMLGIGDSLNDWTFMKNCGYQGVMGNADERLKVQVDPSNSNQSIGRHVDEDGMIDIIDNFVN